ncbi:MAG: hypothetical protein AB8G18_14120 [Gammaproteobacteria bacterium]
MNNEKLDLGDRLIGVFFALIFFVPTAFVIWFAVNRWSSGAALLLPVNLLWITAVAAAIVGFLSPKLLIDALGKIWSVLQRILNFSWW